MASITNVALFWDPSKCMDRWNTNTLLYTGQKKMKNMDRYFDQGNTSFYIFKKHYKLGWRFVGKAVVNRRIRDRVAHPIREQCVSPIWEMSFEPSCAFTDTITSIIDIYHRHITGYLSKEDLFTMLEFESVLSTWSTGIVPFHK